MNDYALGTIAQLRAFLNGTQSVSFAPFADDDTRYARIASVVRRFGYVRLSKPDKGVVRRYLPRTSGYYRSQLSRLLARVLGGPLLDPAPPRPGPHLCPVRHRSQCQSEAGARPCMAVCAEPRRPMCCAALGICTAMRASSARHSCHPRTYTTSARPVRTSSPGCLPLRPALWSPPSARAPRAQSPGEPGGLHPHQLRAPGRSGRHQ